MKNLQQTKPVRKTRSAGVKRGRPPAARKAAKGNRLLAGFWRPKSLEALAREQGVRPIARLEEVLGKGAALWDDDRDFDAFVSAIQERRRQEA